MCDTTLYQTTTERYLFTGDDSSLSEATSLCLLFFMGVPISLSEVAPLALQP